MKRDLNSARRRSAAADGRSGLTGWRVGAQGRRANLSSALRSTDRGRCRSCILPYNVEPGQRPGSVVLLHASPCYAAWDVAVADDATGGAAAAPVGVGAALAGAGVATAG